MKADKGDPLSFLLLSSSIFMDVSTTLASPSYATLHSSIGAKFVRPPCRPFSFFYTSLGFSVKRELDMYQSRGCTASGVNLGLEGRMYPYWVRCRLRLALLVRGER